MALSGNLKTNSYDGRYYTLTWSATQSIPNNQSTIAWEVSCAGGVGWYAERTLKVVLGGKTLINKTDRVERNAGKVASGSFVLTHSATGALSISGSMEVAVYTSAVNCKASGSWALNNIPRAASISTATNFNDEDNPTITYSNPLGNNVTSLKACIANVGGSVIYAEYRDISKTGISYTFNLTDAERSALRSAAANSNSIEVMFYVTTVYGGVTYYSTLKKTMSIINATPTFTSSVKDTGAASTVLTGATAGNVSMIKGFNYMECSMVATAYKGATIKSYKISNGSNVVNAATATFNNSEHNSFKFEVWDSRGNYNTYTQEIRMIDYLAPTCSVEARIALGDADSTTANITFTTKGNVFNGSFGAISNSLSLDYTISNDAGEIAASGSLEAIYNGNTYSAEKLVEGLDYRKSYIVYVAAHDAINSGIPANSKMLKAIPVFDWSEEDFNFNVPINMNGNTILRDNADYGHTVLAANGGSVYIRPNGADSSEAEFRLYPNGTVSINGSNMADFVVEQGTSGIWEYTKWNSGRCELYGLDTKSITISLQNGNIYYSNNIQISFPFEITNKMIWVDTQDYWCIGKASYGTSTTAMVYRVFRGQAMTEYSITSAILVKGRWK